MERYPMFINRKIQYGKDAISSQLDLWIQCNPNQNLSKPIFAYQLIDSEAYLESQNTQKSQYSIIEDKVRALPLLDFKTSNDHNSVLWAKG